jgi:hypothetical protein
MKKVIAVILMTVVLCSCVTFKSLPKKTQTGLVVSSIVMTAVAIAITFFAIKDYDNIFKVGL